MYRNGLMDSGTGTNEEYNPYEITEETTKLIPKEDTKKREYSECTSYGVIGCFVALGLYAMIGNS